jgi:UDP-N-acetylmuramyl pentapeptide phosphotransferase/UDP-N-acetylglucosamine-1-phosphate transferase
MVIAFFVAFMLAAAGVLLLTPLVRMAVLRLGALDRPGERSVHRHPVPTLGGLAIAGAFAAAVLGNALEALRIVALLAWLAVPSGATEIWRRLGLSGDPGDRRLPGDAAWGGYPGGLRVEKGSPLFPRHRP